MNRTVGPYVFSDRDAERLLHQSFDMLDLYPPEVHQRQGDRRRRIVAALDDADGGLATVWNEFLGAREDRIAEGALPRSRTGAVVGVHLSSGGVPKTAVARAEVGFGGMEGDVQDSRVHHGAPFQALCLWSDEVIAALAAEGHPIGRGSAGENVTISGLDWSEVTPGVRLRIGTTLCQVSSYAVPCSKNARWFSDRNFQRIHHDRGSMSRVYASVLEPGAVAEGDAVVLEP